MLDLLDDGELKASSLIMSTDVDGLFVLPAGRPRLHATELLASARMDRIAASLSSITNDPIIIFDSPPLLQTSEASVVASLVGQIVLVVRAGSTSQEAVLAALATMGDERPINLVLNQVRDSQIEHQYGYAYGYGYGNSKKGPPEIATIAE